MNRRAVIKSMGFISLHALFPTVLTEYLSGGALTEKKEKEWRFFVAEEQKIIVDIIDILLPKTSTKSASEAGVHFFLDEVFNQCMNQEQKKLMKEGISGIKTRWEGREDKARLVRILDSRAFRGEESAAWFKTLKQFTLIGFFSSEEGITKASDYQKLPTSFTGVSKINQDTLVHAKTFLKFYF